MKFFLLCVNDEQRGLYSFFDSFEKLRINTRLSSLDLFGRCASSSGKKSKKMAHLARPEQSEESVRESVRRCLRLPSEAQLRRALGVVLLTELIPQVLAYAREDTFLLIARNFTVPSDVFLDMEDLRAVVAFMFRAPVRRSDGWTKADKALWGGVLSYLRRNFDGLDDVDRWPLSMRWTAESLIAKKKGVYSPSDWYFESRIQDMEIRHGCCDNCRQTTIPYVKELIDDGVLLVSILAQIVESWSKSCGGSTRDKQSLLNDFFKPGFSPGRKFGIGRLLCQTALSHSLALFSTCILGVSATVMWVKFPN